MSQVPDSHRLFVGNLSSKVKEKHVREFFQGDGDISSIDFPEIGAGFCHVNFVTREGAQKALKKNNKMLKGQRVWCNIKQELEREVENFEGHIILEKDVIVNDINNINEVQNRLIEKYQQCGVVSDVLLPKHLISHNKGTAYIKFETEEAVRDALLLNCGSSSAHTIHVPTYTVRPASTTNEGGYGGIYGFAKEDGSYIFEDHLHRKAPHV